MAGRLSESETPGPEISTNPRARRCQPAAGSVQPAHCIFVMSPPQHVKVISVATNAAVLLMGARNVFATGTALPIPGDDKFLAHFGGSSSTAFLMQLFGLFMIATAGAKLTTVVYDEGTFLRQKLFLVLGVVDLLLAFTVFNYKALGTDVTGGFVLLHALEGAAFLHDALTRERKVKRVQRSASTRSKRA